MDGHVRDIMQQMSRSAKQAYDRLVFEMVRSGVGFRGWEVSACTEPEFRRCVESSRADVIPLQCSSTTDLLGIMGLLHKIGCRQNLSAPVNSTFLTVRRVETEASCMCALFGFPQQEDQDSPGQNARIVH